MAIEFSAFLPLVLLMLAVGTGAGFLSGLLGVGGGFLLVPGLYYCFQQLGYQSDILMHFCIGTALAIIVPTVLSSARAHYKKHSVDFTVFKDWIFAMVFGVGCGVYLASLLSSTHLVLLFAVTAILTSAYMFSSKEKKETEHKLPKSKLKYILASIIGMITALMGIGGAIVSVPVMSAFSVPIQRAIGTAAAMGVVTSFIGACGYMVIGWHSDAALTPPCSVGYVNIIALAIVVPASALMAPVGAHCAHKMNPKLLKRIFAVLLALIAIKMLIQGGIFS